MAVAATAAASAAIAAPLNPAAISTTAATAAASSSSAAAIANFRLSSPCRAQKGVLVVVHPHLEHTPSDADLSATLLH